MNLGDDKLALKIPLSEKSTPNSSNNDSCRFTEYVEYSVYVLSLSEGC